MLSQLSEGLTFDDVLLLPGKCEVDYNEISLSTNVTRHIKLKIPILSAAMDTVTEARLAIALAQLGGIGIIHKNFSPEEQAQEVEKVKRYEGTKISRPITVSPEDKLEKIMMMRKQYGVSGFPVVKGKKLVGIVTHRDVKFLNDYNVRVKDIMTKKLVTAQENITAKNAEKIFRTHKIEKLPLVDKRGNFKGLMTSKDLLINKVFPNATKDKEGRLLVGAAVDVDLNLKREEMLVDQGVDVLVVDKAHGHTENVKDKIQVLKKKFKTIDVVAGNCGTAECAEFLIKAGADAVKVGIGPGSICTTRVISGVGVPQLTAIVQTSKIAKKYNIPLIADGGIKYSGDIVKALAAGASTVMLGNLLAGVEESPGELIHYRGKSYKVYRGMGSIASMIKGGASRYFQAGEEEYEKFIPEGIEGQIPYRGSLAGIVHQLVGGIKSGMMYIGCKNIHGLQKAKFIKVTSSGVTESHPHDVEIIKETPNYWRE
ncbi:MAG: IMP dehydrogenase [Spirochaetes bacterium]|nr:IMP dehydrogenase [Spirochaetota bacterium]